MTETEFILNPHERVDGDDYQMGNPQYIEVDKNEIVYFVNHLDSGVKSVIIPGIVVSEEYQTKYGKRAVKVDMVRDIKLKSKIEDKLRKEIVLPKHTLAPLNFWKGKN